MLRLFKIDVDGKTPVYFNNKRQAKAERDKLREAGHTQVVVMRGPDHRRGESFNKAQRA